MGFCGFLLDAGVHVGSLGVFFRDSLGYVFSDPFCKASWTDLGSISGGFEIPWGMVFSDYLENVEILKM